MQRRDSLAPRAAAALRFAPVAPGSSTVLLLSRPGGQLPASSAVDEVAGLMAGLGESFPGGLFAHAQGVPDLCPAVA